MPLPATLSSQVYGVLPSVGQVTAGSCGPRWSGPSECDLGGTVQGRAIASPALRLVSHRVRATAPGSAELRLTMRHAELPLEVLDRELQELVAA